MASLYANLFNFIRQIFNLILPIFTQIGGWNYIIGGFTIYSIVRFLVLPMLKNGPGMSDTVEMKKGPKYNGTYNQLQIEDKNQRRNK